MSKFPSWFDTSYKSNQRLVLESLMHAYPNGLEITALARKVYGREDSTALETLKVVVSKIRADLPAGWEIPSAAGHLGDYRLVKIDLED